MVEWWRGVGVFEIDVSFVVKCLIVGILLWVGGGSNTNRAMASFISFVVWVPYLELGLLVTGTVGFG